MQGFKQIATEVNAISEVEFAICFVTTKAQIDEYAAAIAEALGLVRLCND